MPQETQLRHVLAFGFALTTLLTAQQAFAFCRTTTCRETASEKCNPDDSEPPCKKKGFPLWWRDNAVEFKINAGLTSQLPPNDARNALLRAFASWNNLTCPDGGQSPFFFVPGGDTNENETLFNEGASNNVNIIFYRENGWPYKGIDGTLATTSVSFDVTTGEIWDADIAINAANNTLTTNNVNVHFDVESIVVHEVGHFIGINHSGDPEALMAPTYNEGDRRRALRPDDVAAACAIYPPGREPVPKDTGCSTSAAAPAKGTSSAFALLLALPLAAALRKRRNEQKLR